ncbi:hypothetical protein PSHT_07061, partial [Puccinia striiformis]
MADLVWPDLDLDKEDFAISPRNWDSEMKKFLTMDDMYHILRAHELCMEGFLVLYDDQLSTRLDQMDISISMYLMPSLKNERDGPQPQMQLQQRQQQLQMQHQQNNGGQDNGMPNPYMLPQVE